jgi:hypothetical protein
MWHMGGPYVRHPSPNFQPPYRASPNISYAGKFRLP